MLSRHSKLGIGHNRCLQFFNDEHHKNVLRRNFLTTQRLPILITMINKTEIEQICSKVSISKKFIEI